MYTYTTPTITCTLGDIDFTDVEYVRIAIAGKDTIVYEVALADIDTEAGTAAVTLTQDDTAAIGPGRITIQARIIYTDGTVQATNKVTAQMNDVIDRVVV